MDTAPTLDISYLAGFFDGEGTLGIYRVKRSGHHYLRVSLCQNRSMPVDLLFKQIVHAFGGSLTVLKAHGPKKRPHVTWSANSANAAHFLAVVGPHLRVKAEQARTAHDWYTLEQSNIALGKKLGRQNLALTTVGADITTKARETLRQLKHESPSLPELATEDPINTRNQHQRNDSDAPFASLFVRITEEAHAIVNARAKADGLKIGTLVTRAIKRAAALSATRLAFPPDDAQRRVLNVRIKRVVHATAKATAAALCVPLADFVDAALRTETQSPP